MPSEDRIELDAHFAGRLKTLRAERGLTQTQLADLLGVSFASVNRWENGAKPSRMAWELLARFESASTFGSDVPEDLGRVADSLPVADFLAPPEEVRVVTEAERLSFGHLANPAFATEVSLIDPLPHQRIAVYEHMLNQPRLRFLLADDAGAGKTIMAGLYIREMLARRLIRRVLVVPPAGLVGNWERELRTLFSLNFRIVRGADTKTKNPFIGEDSDRLICSVDTLRQDQAFARLQEDAVVPYDLVIFDEAHKLSADREPDLTIRKTDRYKLAEVLAGVPESSSQWTLGWSAHHLLLLTATPHMGKDFPYYALWRLLEPEMLATVDAFNSFPPEARSVRFIRRTKEEMVRFDGKPLYPRRETNTLSYDLTQGESSEQALYDDTTAYMEAFYNKARILNRSAAKLAMSVFQRRLASSTYALSQSFQRRLERLDGLIAQLRDGKVTPEQMNAAQRAMDEELFDPFEETTADEESGRSGREDHEFSEDDLLRAVVTQSLGELEAERSQVSRLLELSQRVLDAGQESKFEKLREILFNPEYRGEKALVFTEHRDTLVWLTKRLEAMGFTDKVACLHGGMDYREREQQVEFFKRPGNEGGAQVLVATDAAGEGINLQFCWLMVNYDIPWNPARLEQRLGRIHRYGQKRDPVVIVNLVAGKTREGRVLKTLLEKLEKIRKELRSDKVFDVVGRLFENIRVSDFMAAALSEAGAAQVTGTIEGMLTPEQVKALEVKERAIYGHGGDVKRELARIRGQMESEIYRRLIPGYVRQFVGHAAEELGFSIGGDLDGVFAFKAGRTGGIDELIPVIESYPTHLRNRFTVHRPVDKSEAIFLHPGERLFERLRTVIIERFAAAALRGAAFIDPTTDDPYFFHLAEVTIVRRRDPATPQPDLDEVAECRLVGIKYRQPSSPGSSPWMELCPVEQLLLLRGAESYPTAWAKFASLGPESIVQSEAFLAERVAQSAIAERRHRLMNEMPAREQFLLSGYDSHDAELAASRVRLAEKARTGNAAARKSLERVKDQQRSLAERRDAAIADLRAEPSRFALGGIRFIAHALAVPSSDPEDRKRHDADVEAVAMRIAWAHEEAQGATVKDVSTPPKARAAGLADNPGFDLLAIYPDGKRRGIEVKGRASIGSVEVTENEWARACNMRGEYWLHVVYDCGTPYPRLCRVRDPFGRLLAKAKGSMLLDSRDVLDAQEQD